jgi:hypothetical protein
MAPESAVDVPGEVGEALATSMIPRTASDRGPTVGAILSK